MLARGNPVPGALIARLVLTPDDLGGLRVFGQLCLKSFLWEGIQLLKASNGNCRNFFFAPRRHEVVVDLAGTENHPRHFFRVKRFDLANHSLERPLGDFVHR